MRRPVLVLFLILLTTACGRFQASRALTSLGDPDAAKRAAAAETLGKLRHAEAAAPLRAAVKDKDPRVRKAALIALAQIGDAGAFDLAIELRGQPGMRETSDAALQALGSPAEKRLMSMLGTTRRSDAISALGGVKSKDSVPRLLELLGDPSEEVAMESARALGRIGDQRAVPPLLASMCRPGAKMKTDSAYESVDTNEIRWAAAEALGWIGAPAVPSLLEALEAGDENVRARAAHALRNAKDPRSIEPLIHHLGDVSETGNRVQAEVVQALIALGPPALPAVTGALRSSESRVRDGAVMALGQSNEAGAIEALIAALGDPSNDVRRTAGFFISMKADHPRIDSAMRELLAKKDYRAIRAAMRYYVIRGLPGSEPTLIEALNREEGEITDLDPPQLFLNSGNARLEQAARAWADAKGYSIEKNPEANLLGARWGGGT